MNYDNVTTNYKGHTVVEDEKEIKSQFKLVSEEEFLKFVDEYPNYLTWNVTTVCDPYMGNHNDFTDGKKWPDSMVTKVIFLSDYGQENEYYVKELV